MFEKWKPCDFLTWKETTMTHLRTKASRSQLLSSTFRKVHVPFVAGDYRKTFFRCFVIDGCKYPFTCLTTIKSLTDLYFVFAKGNRISHDEVLLYQPVRGIFVRTLPLNRRSSEHWSSRIINFVCCVTALFSDEIGEKIAVSYNTYYAKPDDRKWRLKFACFRWV